MLIHNFRASKLEINSSKNDTRALKIILDRLRATVHETGDCKRWMLTGNGSFTVKSFYKFLDDGGLCCARAKLVRCDTCPKKINIFNWLVWKNKILSLEILKITRCTRLQTATYVMCHSGI